MGKLRATVLLALGGASARRVRPNERQTGVRGGRRRRRRVSWRIGMVVMADGGAFRQIGGTVTVPMEWPEQPRVRVVDQDLSRRGRRQLQDDRRRRPANARQYPEPGCRPAGPGRGHFRDPTPLCRPRPKIPTSSSCPPPSVLTASSRPFSARVRTSKATAPRSSEGAADRRRQGESLGEGGGDLRLGPRKIKFEDNRGGRSRRRLPRSAMGPATAMK